MITKKSLAWISAFIALALVAPLVLAFERIADGGFEAVGPANEIFAWPVTNTGMETTWNLVTAPEPVRTGLQAARLTNTSTTLQSGLYNGVRIRNCIDITTPDPTPAYTDYSFSGYVYIPSDNANFQQLRVLIRYYTTAGCGGGASSAIAEDYFDIDIPRDEWVYFRVTAPRQAGRDGMGLWLETRKTTAANSVVYFDDLRFYDSTPTAVSLHSFAVQPDPQQGWLWWGGGVGITAVFLLYLRRRRQ
jgi:hypothetical protein